MLLTYRDAVAFIEDGRLFVVNVVDDKVVLLFVELRPTRSSRQAVLWREER